MNIQATSSNVIHFSPASHPEGQTILKKPRTTEDIMDVANYLRIMMKDYQTRHSIVDSQELGKRLCGLEWNIEDLISGSKIEF